MKTLKKLFKYLAYFVGGLLLLILLLLVVLRIPAVQTGIANKVTNALFKDAEAKIQIEKVAINFIDNVCLQGVYASTAETDTLLYAQQLTVDISIFKLLNKTIVIDNITLENSFANVYQNEDGTFNFQPILDVFTSTDTTQKRETETFDFQIRTVEIKNADYTFNLLNAKNHLLLKNLFINVNSLDLEKLAFNIEELAIDGVDATSIWDETASEEIIDTTTKSIDFPLATLPISLQLNKISLQNSKAIYEMGKPQKTAHFNPNYLHIDTINIKLEDVLVNDSLATANINQIQANLNNQFEINKASGNLYLSDKKSEINNLNIETKNSKLDITAAASYLNFESFINFNKNTVVDIDIPVLKILPSEIAFFVPELNNVEAFEKLSSEKLEATVRINGSLNTLTIDDFYATISQTDISLSGRINNMLDYENASFQNIEIDATTKSNDVRKMLGSKVIHSGFNRFKSVDLKTNLSGSLQDLNFHKLDIATKGTLQASLTGNIKNIIDLDNLKYNVNINNIKTSYADAAAIVDSLPDLLKNFTEISYNGTLAGGINTYDLEGTLKTNLGNVNTDLFTDFNQDFSNASYEGLLNIENFDVGTFLSNDSIGNLTATINADGVGLELDSIHTVLDATIHNFVFKSYEYNNVEIDGNLNRRDFIGNISIDDENLQFDFNGEVNLNDSIPILSFTANLDKINTRNLNLTAFPLEAQLKINSNLTGITLNDIDGKLTINDIILKNEKSTYKTDSIVLLAENKVNDNREIHLKSDFLLVDITGNYSIENLPKILANFGDQYFPFSTFIGGKDVDDAIPKKVAKKFEDAVVDVNIALSKPTSVLSFFKVELENLDTANLQFKIKAPEKLLDFELFVPEINYSGIYANSVYAKSSSNAEKLDFNFRVDSINIINLAYVPDASVNFTFKEQKATMAAYIANDTGGYSLGVLANLVHDNNLLQTNLEEPFILNTKKWNVEQSTPFAIGKDTLIIPEISLSNKKEALSFATTSKGLKLDFNQFNINNLLELVEIDSTTVKGLMNGAITLNTEEENIAIEGDLSIKNIKVNETGVGDLSLEASKIGETANAIINLKGNNNDISINANYQINEDLIDGKVNISRFNVVTIEPFLQSFATNTKGYVSGNLNINGTTKEPALNGKVLLNEVEAFVKPIGTKYAISQGSIQVEKSKISPNFTLRDNIDRRATLSGSITHNFFSDFAFDLQFNADAFTFLDSKKGSNDLFYGKFVAAVNANITGNLDLPVIRGSLSTIDESDITLQLLSPQAIASQESYVLFVDGSEYSLEEIDSIAKERYNISAGIDLNITVNVDDDATLRLIIDPLTGDNLEINGNAQLLVKMQPYGELDINGIYTVTEGFYRFSFQRFLKRKFELRNGSQINFTGNPMNAKLDLAAIYNTEVNTFSLIEDEAAALSESEKQQLKKKVAMQVVLHVEGKLSEPKLGFDIEMLDSGSGPVGNSVTRALNRIKQNETELNKQVFSLLLFNSFVGGSSNGNISATGASSAVRSVGNLINTQLNRLTSKAEGFQIDFDLDQYENQFSETGDQITEIDLGVSQTLLNDKITISVGGNVDLESGRKDGAISNVAGDFVLTYNITDNGKCRIRVFQKSDFDALNDANVWKTGAGFTYQTKFGNLKRKKSKKE